MVVEMVDLRESSFSVESSERAETLGTPPNPCQKSFPNFWGRSEQQNKSYEQDTTKKGKSEGYSTTEHTKISKIR